MHWLHPKRSCCTCKVILYHFLDKDATSLSSDDPLHTPTDMEDEGTQKSEKPRLSRRMTLSPEKAQDVLVSVVEEHAGKKHREPRLEDVEVPALPTPVQADAVSADPVERKLSSSQEEALSKEEFQHLDLAVPSDQTGLSPPISKPLVDHNSNDSVLRFVFGPLHEDLDAYSQRSSLERAVIAHIKAGNTWHFQSGWLEL